MVNWLLVFLFLQYIFVFNHNIRFIKTKEIAAKICNLTIETIPNIKFSKSFKPKVEMKGTKFWELIKHIFVLLGSAGGKFMTFPRSSNKFKSTSVSN